MVNSASYFRNNTKIGGSTSNPLGWPSVVILFWCGTFLFYCLNLYKIYDVDYNILQVIVFMVLVSLSVLIGSKLGDRSLSPALINPDSAKKLFLASLLFNLLLLPFNIQAYTGASLGQLPYLALHPAQAYDQMHDVIDAGRGDRIDLLTIKAVFGWLIAPFIPLAFILYREGRIRRFNLVLAIFCSIAFSVARGTDKELFDVAILYVSTWFLPRNESDLRRKRPIGAKIWGVGITISSSVLLLSAFIFRKSTRLADLSFHCFEGTDKCVSLMPYIGNPLAFLLMMAYRYLTQGFNGLAASFSGSWTICPLVGHSRPLSYLASSAGYDCPDTLLSQLDFLGWTSHGAWSTGFVQLGNDWGIWAVPITIAILAAFTAALRATAAKYNCYICKVLFVYNIYTMLYMIGNLQLAQSGDVYFGYITLSLFVLAKSIFRMRPNS